MPDHDFHLHRALDNLELGVSDKVSGWPDCDTRGVEAWKSEASAATKVLLTPGALACVDDMPQEVRVRTCLDMIRADVFRLPFEELVVQSLMYSEDKSDKLVFMHLKQCSEDEGPQTGGSYRVRARVFTEWGGRTNRFYVLPVEMWLTISLDDDTKFEVHTSTAEWYRDHARARQVHSFLRDNRAYLELCVVLTTALVLLSSTRGVVKRQVQARPSSRRLALLRRRTPEFSHTVLELHRDVAQLSGKTYVTAEGRTRPRLHWRRGHERQQACGPNRSERRPVWVSAHLVGHGEDGSVTHDYSVK